jgi:hypothetical protein
MKHKGMARENLKPEKRVSDPETNASVERIAASRSLADQVGLELKQTTPFLGDRLVQILCQRAFELAAARSVELKDWSALVGLILKARQQANAERKGALLEEQARAEAAKRAEPTSPGGLTPEVLREIQQAAELL